MTGLGIRIYYPFQSTPSAWRETSCHRSIQLTGKNFNPLPPHGGRLYVAALALKSLAISIHSLRMEGDSLCLSGITLQDLFQSTPSAWRETAPNPRPHVLYKISIHSLRMEGDFCSMMEFRTFLEFQSTPSAWRETRRASSTFARNFISIHSLRMEGDCIYYSTLVTHVISIHSLRMEGD